MALLLAEQEGRPPDPRAIGTGLHGVLESLAGARPLVLAIDDVQWLDAASASALTFAVRRLRERPVRLLLAVRTTSREADPVRLAAAVPNNALVRVEVTPLTLGAVNHLLRARVEASLSLPVIRRVYETSGGNPFFALELARALVQHGRAVEPGQPLPVPDTLQGLVAERITTLPVAAQEAMLVVALASEPTLELVGRALEGDPWERLRPAAEAETIELDGETIGFSHPLIASVAEAGASAKNRRDAHRRLAELVRDPEERALHLSMSASGPDEAVASALEFAGERASMRGAPDARLRPFRTDRRKPTGSQSARRRRWGSRRFARTTAATARRAPMAPVRLWPANGC